MTRFNPCIPPDECISQGGQPIYSKSGEYNGCLWKLESEPEFNWEASDLMPADNSCPSCKGEGTITNIYDQVIPCPVCLISRQKK